MKLHYRIVIRLFPFLTLTLAVWGCLFYWTIIDEVNDEIDDSLENYSEDIIIRALAGQELPSNSDGTNNSFFLKKISEKYALQTPQIRYSDRNVYIASKKETEPSRQLVTIFKNGQGDYFELTVSTPSIEKEDLLTAILSWIIILYFLLLFVLLTINIWVFHKSMRPLYLLLKWLDNYSIDQKTELPELQTNITEFRKLQAAALQTIKRNNIIYEQQKQFIGNASHELQTPLAICQNRLEILAEMEDTSEQQLNEINKIQETLSYIIRLNKSLLFLSKIENGQYQDNKPININELLKRHLEDYQDIFSYKNIRLTIEEHGSLTVVMDSNLATALTTNLLKNAYLHNITNGEIHIIITPHSLTLKNTGTSQALDGQKIFQRFYQGKTNTPGSSGLGLSISAAICRLYHIKLSYSYDGLHQFKIEF